MGQINARKYFVELCLNRHIYKQKWIAVYVYAWLGLQSVRIYMFVCVLGENICLDVNAQEVTHVQKKGPVLHMSVRPLQVACRQRSVSRPITAVSTIVMFLSRLATLCSKPMVLKM